MSQCNVCAATLDIPAGEYTREGGICGQCRSNVRFRSIAHLISLEFFGTSLPVCRWPPNEKVLIGISDWPAGGEAFSRVLRYVNTQFDRAQFPDHVHLDITNPSEQFLNVADAITCSDVLEHVPPPAQAAFDGLYRVLKPGGGLVFTVPYGFETTVEHFPDLYDWSIHERRGERFLFNRTIAGQLQVFDKLIFHGGGEEVLEMRLFGLRSIIEHLERAGFESIQVMTNDVPEYGIIMEPWSRPIVARRPNVSPVSSD